MTQKRRVVLLVGVGGRAELDDEDITAAGLPRLVDVVPHHFWPDATDDIQRAGDVHFVHIERHTQLQKPTTTSTTNQPKEKKNIEGIKCLRQTPGR